jgi:hypothetical protein
MVVGNFDVESIPLIPAEADAILIVDPDAVLPLAASRERFQPVSGEQCQVAERACPVQVEQLAKRDPFYAMKLFREPLPKDLFRLSISKRANHGYIVYRKSVNVKRTIAQAVPITI